MTRIVLPTQQLERMAREITDLAIRYIEIAHQVSDLVPEYGDAFPSSDRGWVEADLRALAGRVEDLAFYWEPDVAALLLAARIAEQEESIRTGTGWAFGIVDFAYGVVQRTDKHVAMLRRRGMSVSSFSSMSKLVDDLADDAAVKGIGRAAAVALFALDWYDRWEEGDHWAEAMAKASVPLGFGLAGTAAGTWGCGLFIEGSPIAVGVCAAGVGLVSSWLGSETVEAYERHFDDDGQ
jgi:hypothetical protein